MENVEVIRPAGMPLNRVHGAEYANLTAEQVKDRAINKLQEYIDKGQRQAQTAVERIMGEEIQDRILPATAMRFAATQQYSDATDGKRGILLRVGEAGYEMADHALDQAANRLGFATRTLHDFAARGDWGRELAAHNLNELAAHAAQDDRYLVRRVGTQVRGVLSNSFKPEDSRSAIDALLGVARDVGALVAGGWRSIPRPASRSSTPSLWNCSPASGRCLAPTTGPATSGTAPANCAAGSCGCSA